MSGQSDGELIKGAKRGDSAAVAELFRRYWKGARAVAYGVTADLASAEDAAAEGLQSALTSLEKLRNPERFGPWLRTIVVRTARRQRPREAGWEEPSAISEGPSPEDNLERRELALLIHEAVDQLPRVLREAISLHYFDGYAVSEGAQFLGIPAGTLKRRLHDGRRQLEVTCEAILKGREAMNAERDRVAERIERLLGEGYDPATFLSAVKEMMRLRPPPYELMHRVMTRLMGPKLSGEQWERTQASVLQALREHGRPSERVADPNHVVGRAHDAILAALPHFERWELSPEEVTESLAARYRPDSTARSRFLLPPRLAEGLAGAYVRTSSSIVVLEENGGVAEIGAILREDNAPATASGKVRQRARLSDVVDLTWMEAGSMGLHDVEHQLRELARKAAVGVGVRFSAYEGLRYRAALRMHLGESTIPAAIGGILHAWPGMVEGTSAAHVRVYLEVWASVISGTEIQFRSFPPFQTDLTVEQNI